MEGFKSYLLSRRLIQNKTAEFYLYWVTQFYKFCHKRVGDPIKKEEVGRYLDFLSKHREMWQVNQASDAIQRYLFYRRRGQGKCAQKNLTMNAQWKEVAEDMHRILRLKHRSLRTEQTYMEIRTE